MLSLLMPLLAGMACGVVTGLLPGLHPNAVMFLLLPVYFRMRPGPLVFVAFATGVSTVHTFVSFIPAVFVGAPAGDTALSVLPGHRFLRAGRGFEAVELTVYGGLVSSLAAVVALPAVVYLVPPVYDAVSRYMHVVLLLALAYLVGTEEHRGAAAGVVVLSGLLGVLVLNSPLANTQYVLFPLFAGMFGFSVVLPGLWRGSAAPPQGRSLPVRLGTTVTGGARGFLAGLVAGFLPGIGSSQSALLVRAAGDTRQRDFLVTLGGITTADLFLSLVALYVIGKPRSGAAVAMQQVLPAVHRGTLLQVVGMSLVGVGAGALVTRRLASRAAGVVQAADHRQLLGAVAVFIAGGSVVLNGWFGLLILVTATGVGLLAAASAVRRSTCMAVLIVPTILYYAGVTPQLF